MSPIGYHQPNRDSDAEDVAYFLDHATTILECAQDALVSVPMGSDTRGKWNKQIDDIRAASQRLYQAWSTRTPRAKS